MSSIRQAMFVAVHVKNEGDTVHLSRDEMQGVTEAMQNPSQAVVTGFWVDQCTNVGRMLDHRKYAVEIVGSLSVRQTQPTPRLPLPGAGLEPSLDNLPPPSPDLWAEQARRSPMSLPTPPPSTTETPIPKPPGRPRKSAPLTSLGPASTNVMSLLKPPAKRPRRFEPPLARLRSNSSDSTSSSSSFSELRPTLRSDLSRVTGPERSTFLGIERDASPPRRRKAKTWDRVDREEDVDPEDEIHLHLLAASLNIWVETHMPAGMMRAQVGWKKAEFLENLSESVSSGPVCRLRR